MTAVTRGRDSQRGLVYSAEDLLRSALDARSSIGVIEIAGTRVTLPPEARFASIESMQRYVDAVLSRPSVRERFGCVAPVRVRARRGTNAAHYEPNNNTIAVPVGDDSTPFRRESVVVHELAHHLTEYGPHTASHGPEFVCVLLWLIGDVMGAEAAFVLRTFMFQHGVRVG
ncbi:TIGR04338 family metallohydrolase [Gordonia otitidis]|uniref:TIGR04338 family metallohydrolase n=1 Tax=Gordonia otitidis (strain DSM 44809 / CCUG 52243 / JCM 12355 / NBRC 100426 / IFM 10032) TaxID=1108044 RepID=H5TS65_GORO1|nr:TIGR04338 family metallohydrolase [Gordonia otitidis]GAB36323.1 hypothetical protein GOOTI_207_00080 [Gordonia otitidis NBRC 100426]